jgi:hypothetical protein
MMLHSAPRCVQRKAAAAAQQPLCAVAPRLRSRSRRAGASTVASAVLGASHYADGANHKVHFRACFLGASQQRGRLTLPLARRWCVHPHAGGPDDRDRSLQAAPRVVRVAVRVVALLQSGSWPLYLS